MLAFSLFDQVCVQVSKETSLFHFQYLFEYLFIFKWIELAYSISDDKYRIRWSEIYWFKAKICIKTQYVL